MYYLAFSAFWKVFQFTPVTSKSGNHFEACSWDSGVNSRVVADSSSRSECHRLLQIISPLKGSGLLKLSGKSHRASCIARYLKLCYVSHLATSWGKWCCLELTRYVRVGSRLGSTESR